MKLILSSEHEAECGLISREFNIELAENSCGEAFILFFQDGKLSLKSAQEEFGAPIFVDFLAGKSFHRFRFGGGKGQLIAKAVGIKSNHKPQVLDLTAGLGQDAFVLASLGCDLTMLERSPAVGALLRDALNRAEKESWFKELKLKLIFTQAKSYLENLAAEDYPEIIYFDPMFPESKKSALVKKEMRLLRALHGDDEDANDLLDLALKKARKKVIVKRPRLSKSLADRKADLVYEGKSSRFDVYIAGL